MYGSEWLITRLRNKLSETNDTLGATLDSDTAPIMMATKPRYKPNRIATIETVNILLTIMPEDEWKEIERRVIPNV